MGKFVLGKEEVALLKLASAGIAGKLDGKNFG